MGFREDSNDFYTLIGEFFKNGTSPRDAREILSQMYEETKLALFLEVEHERSAIFLSLAQDAELQPILFDFCKINTNIITRQIRVPTVHEMITTTSLLDLFLENKVAYESILKWIKSYHPDIMPAGSHSAEDILALQKKLIGCMKKNQFDMFCETLAMLSADAVNDIIHKGSQKFMERVMDAELIFIVHLINLDPSVLQKNVSDSAVLDTLCENPDYNITVLNSIAQKHINSLSEQDKVLLSNTLSDMMKPLSLGDEALIEVDMTRFAPSEPRAEALSEEPSHLPELLASHHMNIIAPEGGFNDALKPYINTRLLLDNSALDAFLFQTFREKLAGKGIALMPTIRSTESIDVDQLKMIMTAEPLTYTTHISVEGGEITPLLNTEIRFVQPINHVIWPVWISNMHYGLFILNMGPIEANAPRGFYIEPLCESSAIEASSLYCGHALVQQLGSLDRASLSEMATNYILQRNALYLTKHLNVENGLFGVVFLAQASDRNYCSDYVIAALTRLVSEDIDLTHCPLSIYAMQNGHLSKDIVQQIRMLEIKMFGVDYFRLQLSSAFDASEVDKGTALFLTSNEDCDHAEARCATAVNPQKNPLFVASLGLFSHDEAQESSRKKRKSQQQGGSCRHQDVAIEDGDDEDITDSPRQS